MANFTHFLIFAEMMVFSLIERVSGNFLEVFQTKPDSQKGLDRKDGGSTTRPNQFSTTC